MAEPKRKSGLGKGLASLIPSGPAKPRLGNDAADIIIGGKRNSDETQPAWYALTKAAQEQQGAEKSGEGKTASQPRPTATKRATGSAATQRTQGNAANQAGTRTTKSAKSTTAPKAPEADTDEATPEASTQSPTISEATATYNELPLASITRNSKNPRQEFETEALQELAHSIKEFGLLQPIVVRRQGEDEYELIMGERRLRASKLAGLETIPAIVRETDDQAMLRDALLENIHRVQLNPLEEGAAYQQLLDEFGVTQAELAQRLGRSRPVISNTIRLLQLPMTVQRRVAAGVLSAGHARALLGLTLGNEAQSRLADRIVAEGLSVRATEEAVTLLNREGEAEPKPTPRATPPQPERLTSWADDFSDILDTTVKVQMGAKKGKIVVEFAGMDDFDRISAILRSAHNTEH